MGDASSTITSGNFFAVREPPIRYADGSAGNPWSGGNDYRTALSTNCAGLPHVLGVGDWLQAEQGNMQGPTRQGIASQCGGGGANFSCNPPVPFVLPIWDVSDKTVAAPNAYRVKYIGVFAVTGFTSGVAGAPDGIRGYFTGMLGQGQFSPTPGPVEKISLVR